MVSRLIVAIGLDAADHALIEKWSADGHLPNLARLRRRGSYGTLRHIEFYSDETPWTNFLTGCTPQRTGLTNERYLERFRTALIDSIDRKRRIALDLLERQRW
ncbi:MAG: hypothetical protein VCC36_01860, partial [Gammaproteobacteria bacterium]